MVFIALQLSAPAANVPSLRGASSNPCQDSAAASEVQSQGAAQFTAPPCPRRAPSALPPVWSEDDQAHDLLPGSRASSRTLCSADTPSRRPLS